jgi:hypothetical protein
MFGNKSKNNYNIFSQLVVVLIPIVHQKNHVLTEIVLTHVLTPIVVLTHYVELMGTIERDVIALPRMKEIHS